MDDDELNLRTSLWAISPQAKLRAQKSNRLSDSKKQFACIYNLIYLLTEKEFSLTSSLDNLPAFIYKNLLSDKTIPEVLRARYLNLLMDDMDFSRYLMDIEPQHFEEVREAVNMEIYCFKVKNAMVNHLDRYEKLCSIFNVPFRLDPVPGRRASRLRSSFIQNNGDSSYVSSASSSMKTEKDYDDAVFGIHNHNQYEDLLVSAIMARYQDLQTKMARLRSTQINLILDRPEVRTAIEFLEQDRYVNIRNRITSGKEKNFLGKAFKPPLSKVVEGIKPEECFSEDRRKLYEIFKNILTK